MRVNGWHRLWIVVSALWLCYLSMYFYEERHGLSLAFRLWLVSAAAVYAGGWVARWVAVGFIRPSANGPK